MTIDRADLEELKNLYFKHYKVKLTDDETTGVGLSLINLFKIILKPIPIDAEEGKGDN